MNKISIEHLAKIICDAPKSRRFSTLTEVELLCVWKDTSCHINKQLSSSRSVHFPGVGHFYVKAEPTADGRNLFFIPTWDHRLQQTPPHGAAASEILNYASIAREGGYTRDDVETGLKDIVRNFIRIVQSNTAYITLHFPKLGRLQISESQTRFRFEPELASSLIPSSTRTTQSNVTATKTVEPICNPSDGTAESAPSKAISSSSTPETSAPPAEVLLTVEIEQQPSTEREHEEIALPPLTPRSDVHGEGASPIGDAQNNAKNFYDSLATLVNTTEKQLQSLGLFRIRSLNNTHMHPHSGNRLWNNGTCPMCRQQAMQPIDLKEVNTRKEKDLERTLLSYSLNVDNEYFKEQQSWEFRRKNDAVLAAEQNIKVAVCKKGEKNPYWHSMGSLYERRPDPPDDAKRNRNFAKELSDQISERKRLEQQEKERKAYEDRLLNQRFVNQFQTSEIEKHVQKVSSQRKQQEVLAGQILEHMQQQQHEKVLLREPMRENHFARDETLMMQQQRQKARQLYQDQLAFLHQKREYETRVAELEKNSHLEKLSNSRKQFEKDFDQLKKSRVDARKSLESYWNHQISLRKAYFGY
ncbi:Coiled-coil domain-containing protein 81 [Quaeritorhiza haematococci]|nr:Coiled-coil domain-containing protein 81 [Quaeritorhiza haematococci]